MIYITGFVEEKSLRNLCWNVYKGESIRIDVSFECIRFSSGSGDIKQLSVDARMRNGLLTESAQ